jgi:hypothetical protein
MAMFRQANRLLVVDQALVLPLIYVSRYAHLVKPWVKNFYKSLLGMIDFQNIRIEDH